MHLHKTPYGEATKKKKYPEGTLSLPNAVVFIARHTTNLRNIARLLVAMGAPPTPPLLVVTDAAQPDPFDATNSSFPDVNHPG